MTKMFRKLLAPLVLGVLFAVPLFFTHTASASPTIKGGGCVGQGFSTGYSSPFNSTKGMCLGGDAQSSENFYQFAVTLPAAISDISISANSGSGTAISFAKESSTLYVSKPDSTMMGYAAPISATTSCTGNASQTVTITASGNGKTQKFSINLCNYKAYNQTLIYQSADQLVGDDGKGSSTGTISGVIHTERDGAPVGNQYRYGVLTKSGIIKITLHNTATGKDTKWTNSSNAYTVGSDGTFTASGIAPGTYNLTIEYNDAEGLDQQSNGTADSAWTSTDMKFAYTNLKVVAGKVTAIGNSSQYYNSATGKLVAADSTTCTDGSAADSSGNCASEGDAVDCDAGGFDWVVCPAIKLLLKGANTLDGFIMHQMNVDVSNIFDNTNDTTSNQGGYYQAWSQFRIIATALLIVGGLVMVASTALGFEFLDAYTIRKTLPRLLIAIIGISLSWPLMRLVVNFFDTVGFDIRAIMYHPFLHMQGSVSVSTGILSSVAVFAGFIAMGPVALTFLLTAFMAIFVGFVILIIRQAAIIMLAILAPVAIACYILPNTQKIWKLWYDNFLGLLLMFPIISALIAACHIFATVTINANQGNSPQAIVGQAIALIAYFIPYFLLPMAARLATGVIGNIAGFVNDRHKGVFDRLKGARGNASAKNMHAMKSGQRFSDRNFATRAFNRTTFSAAAGYKGGFGVGERGKQAYNIAKQGSALGDIMKHPNWAGIQHNDDALRALTYDSAAAARAEGVSEAGIKAAQASVGFGRAQAIAAAQQMAATGTSYNSIEDVARTVARASGGNESTLASIAGNINSETKRAGRHDLAPGFAALHDLSRQAAGMASSNAMELEGGRKVPMSYAKARENAWNSASLYQHANDKGKNIESSIDYFTPLLAGSQEDKVKAAVFFNELKAMQPNASGDVSLKIQKALDENRATLDGFIDPDDARYLGDTPPEVYVKRMRDGVVRSESARERVERLSRTYERPDPNNL